MEAMRSAVPPPHQPGDPLTGQLEVPCVPSRLLGLGAGARGGGGGEDLGLAGEVDLSPCLDEVEVVLAILGEREGRPRDGIERVRREGHPGAEQPAGESEGLLAPGTGEVHQREACGSERLRRSRLGVGDHVSSLGTVVAGGDPAGEDGEEIARHAAVGVDEHDPIASAALLLEPAECPCKRLALPAGIRFVALPDLGSGAPRELGGRIRAVVGDHDHATQLGGVVALEHPRDGCGHRALLVVRGDEDRQRDVAARRDRPGPTRGGEREREQIPARCQRPAGRRRARGKDAGPQQPTAAGERASGHLPSH